MRRVCMSVVALSVWLCGGASCFADGCFMPPKADETADIREPEQKALIWYHNGVEDLVLQVKYSGGVESFAWVVPCPGKPEVDQVEGAPFHELSLLTAPPAMEGKRTGTAGGRAVEKAPGVEVIERKEVGAYDVAVLKAADANALKKWLTDNDFALPESAGPILEHYVERGWYYVAMRIAPGKEEAAAGLSEGVITPLRLTFTCPTIVYPLRMTAVNSGETEVLLYVAGPSRTRAGGFKEEYFRAWPEGFSGGPQYPALAKLFGKAPIALTKLRGRMNTADITDDLYLATQMGAPQPVRRPIYTPARIMRVPAHEAESERILRAPGGFLLWGFGGSVPIGLIALIVVIPLAGALVWTRLRRMKEFREQMEAHAAMMQEAAAPAAEQAPPAEPEAGAAAPEAEPTEEPPAGEPADPADR